LAQALELADAMIDVHDEIPGFEFREVAEEARGADLFARTLERGSALEKIGVAQQRDLGVGKCYALSKWRTDQQKSRGFLRAFRSKAGGGVFRFPEHVRC